MLIAHVALPIPISHTFDYLLSKNISVKVGCRVYVPFGHKKRIGIILMISKKTQLPFSKLKIINEKLDDEPIFSQAVWDLLCWASAYYHYPIGNVLFHAMPILLRNGKKINCKPILYWFATQKGLILDINQLKHSAEQQKALIALRQQKKLLHCKLAKVNLKKTTLQELKRKGLSELKNIESNLCKWHENFSFINHSILLNTEQKIYVNTIYKKINTFSVWLLVGVPGSGKTEVYLNVIKHILTKGKQVLIMMPEINLILKTFIRFRQLFNVPVELLHSNLSNNERLNIWLKAKNGETPIIIGTRSSLFTPFKNLGIIIVDEEHDTSYKQQKGWRYHARDLAVYRAHNEKIPIILSSSTPGLETLYNVQQHKYRMLSFTKKKADTHSIVHQLFDLKGKKIKSGIALSLIARIRQHLQANNQVILFLNRRGFSPSFLCHNCGWIASCQDCDHYYTFYYLKKQLYCHYCNGFYPIPYQCYICGSTHLIPNGFGTERLEKTVASLFPEIPVLRIDRDTLCHKKELKRKLEKVYYDNACILIGTQMLEKECYLPNVTLIVLLDTDSAIFSSDFRAIERFAQLYIRISGQISRVNKKREIVLQTYHPEHPLLQTLIKKGYVAFAEKALIERQVMQLPPWTNHVTIFAEDRNNYQVLYFLQQLHNLLKKNPFANDPLRIIGPIPAFIPKRRGRYRWKILLQHPSRMQLQKIVNITIEIIKFLSISRKVKWILDVDPIES